MTDTVTEVEYKDVIVIFKGVVKESWPSTLTDLIYFGSNPDKLNKFRNIIQMMGDGVAEEFPQTLRINEIYWLKEEETNLVENLLQTMGEEVEVFNSSDNDMPDWVVRMYKLVREDKEGSLSDLVRGHYVK